MIPKQFRIHAVLIVACLFIIVFPLLSDRPKTEKATQATIVAMEFLHLIDAEKYAESWHVTAALMQEKVSQEEWIERLTRARALTGDLVERTEKSVSYSTTAKDSPEGEYVLLTFATRYRRAEQVAEYVTVMLADGRWQVAGYFVQ